MSVAQRREVAPARIVAVAHAVPAELDQQAMWDDVFSAHYGGDGRAARLWAGAGVRRRHAAVDPRTERVAEWSTGRRMERFVSEALPLGRDAVGSAMARAAVDPVDVGLFAVASCTGYSTPGLDIRLAAEIGMGSGVQRLFLGHMGCYAALPGIGSVADFVRARHSPAVLLCAELTSLHVQPPSAAARDGRLARDDVQQVVAHALFADAAAALVVVPHAPGLEVVDVAAVTDPATSALMTWDVTDLGFRMGLSPRVPDVLARHVGPVVERLLATAGLDVDDVAAWAVHPGGTRILDVVGDRLRLDAGALDASYDTLRDCGNCSSATVLLVLERVLKDRGVSDGEHVVMLAFGPGLTLYAVLLRQAG